MHLVPELRIRIKEGRERRHMSRADLAREVGKRIGKAGGISNSSITLWEEGPTERMTEKLWNVLREIMPELAACQPQPGEIAAPRTSSPSYQQVRYLPVLAMAHCAEQQVVDAFLGQVNLGDWGGETIPWIGPSAAKVLALQASGDSMAPTILDGDVAVCEEYPDLSCCIGNMVVAVYHDGQADEQIVLKRLQAITGEGLILTSDNPTFPTLIVPRQKLRCLWLVTGFHRHTIRGH